MAPKTRALPRTALAILAAPAILAAAVGLLSLGLYLATLAPGLTWAHHSSDGGELAAAAHTLGIAHPPGYPTYLLLAHLFTRLPLGEVATRTNLFSAVSAAAAAALLTWTLARRQRAWPAAAFTGLALACSPLLWSQATVTEVYALNGLFAALLLALTPHTPHHTPHSPPPPRGLALAIGATWGLSLGNHPTALFCAPLVLLALWRHKRAWALGGLGLIAGLAVYTYLPLRAAADPPLNWGDPQTIDRFWWVVSGSPYRHYLFSLPLEHLLPRLLAWARILTQQFTWIGLTVALLGAIVLSQTDRPLLYATGTTAALCSILAVGYNTTDSHLYLLPALICLALWLGTGLHWLLSVQARQKWAANAQRLATIAILLLPPAAALHRFSAMDLSHDHIARDFGNTVLTSAPPGALIASQRDDHTFALWYLKHATGRRPDVDTVDIDLLNHDWYTAQLTRRLGIELPASPLSAAEPQLQQWSTTLGRPVCRIDPNSTHLTCTTPN
ncbi:MAG: DUF2723 domain-containing protein [Anaerolineae bacterium]|nr:DUF2723 domain-containing protein [Anaerolineae bacterium]